MATIDFITKRIEGKEKELEKLNGKLKRISIAAESDFRANNPYGYRMSDLTRVTREIETCQTNLTKYKTELDELNVKAASRNIPAITEFLDQWLQRNTNFYMKRKVKYDVALDEMYQKDHEYCSWYNNENYKLRKTDPELCKQIVADHRKYVDNFHKAWRDVTQFERGDKSWEENLRDDLKAEYDRKYDFIVERTTWITGVITDASNLQIGDTGELNGFIIGEKGIAKVSTIGAGGYNIQCFHFRTLIHEMA